MMTPFQNMANSHAGRCTLRPCPFPVPSDSLLCPQHEKLFSYESDLHDRAIEEPYRDISQFIADGLVIRSPKKAVTRPTLQEPIPVLYHQILGSAGMIADALKYLREAPPSQIKDWSTNHCAAQELLELSRYPRGPICINCGRRNIGRYPRDFYLSYLCRLCHRWWSLTTRTILHHRRFTPDRWVQALQIMKANPQPSVIRELAVKLNVSPQSAAHLNHNFRLCGETLGLQLGSASPNHCSLRDAIGMKFGLPPERVEPLKPANLMTIAQGAANFTEAHIAVGKQITNVRKARRLTLAKLASYCQVNAGHLSQIETAQHNPSLKTLLTIAHGLQVTLPELFRGIAATDFSPNPMTPDKLIELKREQE